MNVQILFGIEAIVELRSNFEVQFIELSLIKSVPDQIGLQSCGPRSGTQNEFGFEGLWLNLMHHRLRIGVIECVFQDRKCARD